MQSMAVMAAFAILFIGSAVVCNKQAKARKLNANLWTAMGLLFGPFAIVAILLYRGES